MSNLICPHCHSDVSSGAAVCRGCQSEIEYGAPKMVPFLILIGSALAAIKVMEETNPTVALIALIGLITFGFWGSSKLFGHRVIFKRMYWTR